jgi:hypothetical protein
LNNKSVNDDEMMPENEKNPEMMMKHDGTMVIEMMKKNHTKMGMMKRILK